MGKTLNEIATELRDNNKKIQLIYAFNGSGKTRLSREFKDVVAPKNQNEEANVEIIDKKIIYYNAFTEDLFYWDNDQERKLLIRPNAFTNWVFKEQGQENNIADKFKKYTDSSLSPSLNADFNKITFSFARGNENTIPNIKISKGEESNYVWCVFFAALEELVANLEENDVAENQEANLKYVFIDDPVTSLDDSHLIQLAVELAELIKKAPKNKIQFILTTHNALFYNILVCEFNNYKKYDYKAKDFLRYEFDKLDDGTFSLTTRGNKSPFSYHLFLKKELEKSIRKGDLRRYHFNYLRNLYEKSATFLGYDDFKDLLPKTNDGKADPFSNRIINAYSHLKHSDDDIIPLNATEKEAVKRLFKHLISKHSFKEV